MVQHKYSSLEIQDIPNEDMVLLNNIPDVEFTKHHKSYAVNDLVLELSHFLDEEVVNKKEL